MYKQIAKNSFIGLSIGNLIFLLMKSYFSTTISASEIFSVILMSTMIGFISSIYEVKKLSLLLKTGIQLLGSLILFLMTALYNHWMPISFGPILTSINIFIGIFLIIWIFFYLQEKRTIKNINQKLAQQKKNVPNE